jgi:short-subunit dehydrogenase
MGVKMSEYYTLISGASEGIGYEMVKIFAGRGYNLLLTARNETKLREIQKQLNTEHNIKIEIFAADLSLPQTPRKIFEFCGEKDINVDILINNAGFGQYGSFKETDFETEKSMINLNISALTELCKLFIPPMIENHFGRIMNVASTAAFFPGPQMAVYYASKAYVLSFSESLSTELAKHNITVTALCPGPTRSKFMDRAHMSASRLFNNPLMHLMTSRQVALYAYKALMKGKTVAVPGLNNKFLTLMPRFFPKAAIRFTMKQIMSARK